MVDYAFKLILIGPGAVGKTSLLQRFVNNRFSEGYELTIGVDFMSKKVKLDLGEPCQINLTIWDIGGQKRFAFMRNRFYDGASGALVVFDLSRGKTYNEIKKWLAELRQSSRANIPFILVGNKADLIEDIGEVIESKEAQEFAERENSIYIKTSAKTGENVEDAFNELVSKMIKGLNL